MPSRDISKFSSSKYTQFSSLQNFLEQQAVPSGIISIDYNGSPLDILNVNNGYRTTVVMFHAALSKSVTSLPVFSGMRVLRGLQVNVICISDPSLMKDPRLTLAWFAGNSEQPLQRDLPAVINKILQSQTAKNVVMFGASGGGFAALYYSNFFADSLAIVLNPQTIIRSYDDDFVLSYAKTAFGAQNLNQARIYVDRLITGDVRHLYRGGFNHHVAYVQNRMDVSHVENQAKPFIQAVPNSDKFHLLTGDWGAGHVALPTDISRSLLVSAASVDGNWPIVTKQNGFVSSPTLDILDR